MWGGGILGVVPKLYLDHRVGRGLPVLCCWHHRSGRFSQEEEWLHMAGLLLRREVGLTAAVHLSQPPTWGWTQFPFLSSPPLQPNCSHGKRRVKGA